MTYHLGAPAAELPCARRPSSRIGSSRPKADRHILLWIAIMRRVSMFFVALCIVPSSTASSLPSAIPQVDIPADCLAPPWPKTNVRFGEPPSVDLAFLIDVTGAVLKSRVLKSTGARAFDDAARTAFAKCRYSRPTRPSASAQGWVKVHYLWVLE